MKIQHIGARCINFTPENKSDESLLKEWKDRVWVFDSADCLEPVALSEKIDPSKLKRFDGGYGQVNIVKV